MAGIRNIPIAMDNQAKSQHGTMSELRDYQKVRLLGAGGFGKVYLVQHSKTSIKCAAKEQKSSKWSREEAKVLKTLENQEVSSIILTFPFTQKNMLFIIFLDVQVKMKYKRIIFSLTIQSNHIVTFIGYHEGNNNMSVLLTEYLSGGELFRYISSSKYKLTEAKCQTFAKQIIFKLPACIKNVYAHSGLAFTLGVRPL